MKRSALFFAIGGFFLSLLFGYLAIAGEVTGKTFVYDAHAPPGATIRHRDAFVAVSRDNSPVNFRRGNNFFWAVSAVGIIAAGVGIYFFREMDAYD